MAKRVDEDSPQLINCLRDARVEVRFVPKANSRITNPRHILYGDMSETATKTFVVPKLSSGRFVNVLTDSEKAFLEDLLGLPENAMSVYKKENNFWDDSVQDSMCKVTLTKQPVFLDLSVPEDYIKYKILLANKDFIAPSLKALEENPKVTYQFVLVEENEETELQGIKLSNTMQCYKELGKIEDNADVLRTVIEILGKAPIGRDTKLEHLNTKANQFIQDNPREFLNVVQDPLLKTKVLIKNGIANGTISMRGNYLYLTEGDVPLCNKNEEPTLEVAAKYLNLPKNQELRFLIEAKTNQ